MILESSDFENGGSIPARFTCDGADISPHLAWRDVPEGTKSFALIVDDPDAPGGTWVHWLLCDIPPETREIPRDQVPEGTVQVENDFGKEDYGGPCPPGGVHRYFFRLYALDTEKLDYGKDFYGEIEKHRLAKAVLTGKYGR